MAVTEETTSPDQFRLWAGITTVAGVLERKVWVKSLGSPLYPNLYVIFVADPGIGKSEMTWRVRDLWERTKQVHVGSMNLSRASLIDELEDAKRHIVRENEVPAAVQYNSLQISLDEMGVLIPAYDTDMMNNLTHLYDCKSYHERKRSKALSVEIKKAQLSILSACTPAYLGETLPEGAWNQGFLSRVLLIYAGEGKKSDLFGLDQEKDVRQEDELLEHLKEIGKYYGQMSLTSKAMAMLENFWRTGGPIQPDHPKLLHYNTRRTAHLIKLSTIASVSRSSELVIEESDVERAMGWMLEAEVLMPEIFKGMTTTGPGQNMKECWHYVYTTFMRERTPVQEHRIIQFLQERIPVYNIAPTIDMMVKAQMLKKEITSAGMAYKPKKPERN